MILYVFLIIGTLSIFIGVTFIIKPKLIIKFSEISNKVIITDEQILHYPRSLGVAILFASLFVLYVAVNY